MPNIAQLFKHEIARLARREVRAATAALRKAAQAHRHDIAALKRQIAELERQAERLGNAVPSPIAVETSDRPMRFVAKGFRAHRARLGLSAPSAGKLLGVSEQSVYNWESGKAVPRKDLLARIAAFRGLGKREALQRLKALSGKN